MTAMPAEGGDHRGRRLWVSVKFSHHSGTSVTDTLEVLDRSAKTSLRRLLRRLILAQNATDEKARCVA